MSDYPLTISDDWREVKRFLPSDNRFIIFILKRNGFNYIDSEFIISVRYYTILSVSSLMTNKQVFESEAMLVNWLGRCIVNAAKRTLTSMNAEKEKFRNAVHSMEGKGEDMTGEDYIGIAGEYDEQSAAEQEDVDLFIHHIEVKYGYDYSFLIRERIKGMLYNEIGECIGRTAEQVGKMAVKIRNEYVRYINREEERTGEASNFALREQQRKEVDREEQEERDTIREIRSFIHAM